MWTDEDHQLVADRLERLRDATGADELIITDHADRVRSYELLAPE